MSHLPNLTLLPIDIVETTRAVVWKYEMRDGKLTKPPFQAARPNEKADVTDPTTWTAFTVAYDAVVDGKAEGVGIMLGEGLVGIDLDHCRNPETGEITAEAMAVIQLLDSYSEISPGQTGIHILVRGEYPDHGRRHTWIELYRDRRYFTVTGAHLSGTPREICERKAELFTLYEQYFKTEPRTTSSTASRSTTLSDLDLVMKASMAANGSRFSSLWSGDLTEYAGDDSAGDLALCNLLAFWTRCDAAQMDRLFRQSKLMRPKWDSRRRDSTYGANTIARAIADCATVYEPAIEIEIEDTSEPDASSTSFSTDTSESAPLPTDDWPVLHDDAFTGLAGEFVQALAPNTEAAPAALLSHLLVFFGNLIGRSPRCLVGADEHHLNDNLLIVGPTSGGRKGLALSEIRALMTAIDATWAANCLKEGLSSGEGLIYHVRDPLEQPDPTKRGRVTTDDGVWDKRLAIVESEFAKTLRVSRREGNTLSAVVRQAWDTGTLRILTKNSPLVATGAHVSIVGHITPRELKQELKTTDMASGYINRFLIVLARRSQFLPRGGSLDRAVWNDFIRRFQEAAAIAKQADWLSYAADAEAHWHQIYPQMERPRSGLVGDVCARAAAHVLRLSMIYALIDGVPTIELPHLKAATALWRYAEASVHQIFHRRLGRRLADFLLSALQANPMGLTRTQIRDELGRNRHADEIDEALQLLLDFGLARFIKEEKGASRPTTRWFAVEEGA